MPVSTRARSSDRGAGERRSESAAVQHACSGRGWSSDDGGASGRGDVVRAVLLHLRPRSGHGGVRSAGLQVSSKRFEGPHARMIMAWAVAIAAGILAYGTAATAYLRLPRPQPLEELAYYPSGELLRPATLRHSETDADLAWLRAVQYYGEHRRTDLRFTRMA